MRSTFDSARRSGAPSRLRFKRSNRVLVQNLLLALVWPFFVAVVHVRRFPRHRILTGFVVFCAFAGFVFIPTVGSDAHTYMLHYEALRQGWRWTGSEPVPAALMSVLAWLDLEARWYFGALGLLYGLVVAAAARLLFRDVSRTVSLSLVAIVFVGAFFLNHPVFSAVNARYHLGLWVLLLATLLILDGRWKQALAVAAFGTLIHFGHVLFSLALIALLLSRRLGSWQVYLAYALLAAAFVLPPTLLPAVGEWVANTVGGALGDKIDSSVRYAQITEFGTLTRESERAWFLQWFTTPIFWSLIVSGHLMALKVWNNRDDVQFQLWILIILMWALQLAMAGELEAASRVQRNTTALLLLWHARWFLIRKDGAQLALLINVLPLLFYFVVSYRRWLHQADLGAFLPAPLGVWPEMWPTVMELMGRG